jgi:hypothetical protein
MYEQPLVSEWAVATHVAGKIRVGDRSHRAWAKLHAPTADYPSNSVPALANQLLPAVHAELKAAREAAERATPTPLDLLHDLEIMLHRYIRERLEERYGPTEDGWWVEGVPVAIRQECVQRREADPARDEPFAYTFLIDLKNILEKNWTVFEVDLKRLSTKSGSVSKRALSDCLQHANEIRNRHAHPIRAPKRGAPEFIADHQAAQRALELISGLTGS